jgi:dTMP kinase
MKLFVLEGLDGSGKSTQIKLLTEYFVKKGYGCEYLHFPRTETPYFGELIARFLRGEFGTLENFDPYLVAMLYAGDRKDASDKIRKWMKEGKMVILDRYTYSNIAYQCAKIKDSDKKRELMSWIFSLEFEHFEIPRPDLNIFLNVPITFIEKKLTSQRTGDDRKYLNGITDIHESSLDFQKKVRDIYLEVAEMDERLAVVNCNDGVNNDMLPPGEIFKMIINLIISRKLI